MKAITVKQPWASAITEAGKDVENRTRGTSHRGQLAIHAGMTVDLAGHRDPNIRVWIRDQQLSPGHRGPLGHVVAVAQLVDVHQVQPGCCASPWAQLHAGAHLVLEDVVRLGEPVRANGQLGIWKLSAEHAAKVREQLDGVR